MAKTYNDLYLDVRRALRAAGVEEQALLEARELICCAAEKAREEFYRDLTLYAPGQVEQRVEELLSRRLTGEPMAYVVGEWDFCGLTVDVGPEVLIPRTDTEVLAQQAMDYVEPLEQGARVLDLCAGSGCVGLAIATACPNTWVTLADISEGALRFCNRNIRRSGLSARAACLCVNALEPPPPGLRDFNLIVCNPPYIRSGELEGLDPSVRDFEPRLALDGGADGLDFYRALAAHWGAALKPGGRLMVEVGYDQANSVEILLGVNGFKQVKSTRDTRGIRRVVEGTREDPQSPPDGGGREL